MGAVLFTAGPFISYAYSPSVSVTTLSATNVTPTNATLNGLIDTGGVNGDGWFEYGTDLNFGESTTLNAFIINDANGGSYSTNISGLTANTTYYFRAVGQNDYGMVYANVMSFTTSFSDSGNNNQLAPTAITTSSSVLADNTAQFNALILTGNSSNANTWFEWGTTPELGNQTVSVTASGAPAIRHTNTITGLAPGTAYYFRAVAQNSYGVSDGVVLSFVTSGNPPVHYVVSGGSTTSTSTTSPSPVTSTDTTSVDNSANSSSSALGASAFGAGSFLPFNILSWLIFIILILLLVLLGKHVYSQWKEPTH